MLRCICCVFLSLLLFGCLTVVPASNVQEVVKINEDGGVAEIKSLDDLNKIIATARKPLLVDFYAEWCEHCKEIDKELWKFAEKQKPAPFLLAKFDADKHDPKKTLKIDGFPFFRIYKDGEEQFWFLGVPRFPRAVLELKRLAGLYSENLNLSPDQVLGKVEDHQVTYEEEARNIFAYKSGSADPRVKFFLFAGSSDQPNFAQEIIDQRSIWIKRGVPEHEIACYYSLPNQKLFQKDLERYRKLAPLLKECFIGNVKTLFTHMKASQSQNYIYLYVTSHGDKPIYEQIIDEDQEDRRARLIKKKEWFPFLNDYILYASSDEHGFAYWHANLRKVLEKKSQPNDLFLTSDILSNMLKSFPQKLRKYVILQGCYSGGFLGGNVPRSFSNLTSVKSITVATASRYDRTSFGCTSADVSTYYGGAFNAALAKTSGLPSQIDWRTLANQVKIAVEKKEAELNKQRKNSLESTFYPSLPQFFKN